MLSIQVEAGYFPGLKPPVLKRQKLTSFIPEILPSCELAIFFQGKIWFQIVLNMDFKPGKMSGFKSRYQLQS